MDRSDRDRRLRLADLLWQHAAVLEQNAWLAGSLGYYGLSDASKELAESYRSWGDSIEEEMLAGE